MNAAAEQVFDTVETSIGGVQPDQLLTVWPKVEPMLKRAIFDGSGESSDTVLTALQLGIMQLWVIGDFLAVIVTGIQTRPLHNVLMGHYLAGSDMDTWLDDWITVAEAYARHHNCGAIEFHSLASWHKRLKQSHPEYEPTLTIFRRIM